MNRSQIKAAIKKEVEHPLSNTEIVRMMNGQTKIIRYPEIFKMKSIMDLISPFGNCFILYETSEGHGHWVCLTFHNNRIEFFDPYGGAPDSEFKYINKDFAHISHQDFPYLSRLLQESKMNVSWNKTPFQEFKQGVKSCGRWCVLRCKLKDLSLTDFRKLFHGADGDEIAAFLTASGQI